MTPEKRNLFVSLAILAAAIGSYLEVVRHEKMKQTVRRPGISAPVQTAR
jgi:hypothetical protein